MEAKLKQLINDRKLMKSEFAKTNNTLAPAISQNDYTKSKALYEQLCDLFSEDYFTVHEEFTEFLSAAIADNDSLSSYTKVNG